MTWTGGDAPDAKSTEELLATHDKSVADANRNMPSVGDGDLGIMWEFKTPDGKTIMRCRRALLRSVALNMVSPSGQLSVYLRLLNIPAPLISGPSADEGPAGM